MGKWGSGKVSKTCEGCGSIFTLFRAHLRNGKGGKFCSRKCSDAHRKRKPGIFFSYSCKECEKKFQNRKGRGGTGEYCSIQCMAISRGRKMRGEKHPFWKGGVSERPHSVRLVIQKVIRQKNCCEKCGETTNLQGHHIVPYSENPLLRDDPNNIEVVCSSCHAKEHPQLAGMIARPRFRLGVNLNCEICKKEFYVPKYKEKSAKTCSRKCAMIRLCELRKKAAEFTLECGVCKNRIIIKKSRSKKAKFCSRKCQIEYLRVKNTKSNFPLSSPAMLLVEKQGCIGLQVPANQ